MVKNGNKAEGIGINEYYAEGRFKEDCFYGAAKVPKFQWGGLWCVSIHISLGEPIDLKVPVKCLMNIDDEKQVYGRKMFMSATYRN